MQQIGCAPRPKAPVTTPVELQGAFAACDATFWADEAADPSVWTRQEPENLVRRPNTRG
jgi:hypothetical protein